MTRKLRAQIVLQNREGDARLGRHSFLMQWRVMTASARRDLAEQA